MKRNLLLPLVIALGLGAASCQKQQSDEERKADIERQVQERLRAERRHDDRQKMSERQAALESRINALAAAQKRASSPVATATPNDDAVDSPQESAPAPETGAFGTFYRKLDPYGDWMETRDYGYVFQPQAARTSDWRPYTDGHWVYTDAGWTWISDEKFGWATYHYGRWTRLRGVGWVWVPGEQWAPAWVSWRKGGDYVGWAPLPPEARFDRQTGIRNWADNYYDIGPQQYAFVPANEFGRKLTPREIVPTERNVTIINQTTNVTNIVYNNSVIVDQGPSYDDLRAQSRQPIERYRLERAQNASNDVPVFKGEVVALPTIDFRAAERAARPNRVARKIEQPVVERGWSGIQNAQDAQKARAKMEAEATPPPNLPAKRFVRPAEPAGRSNRPAPSASPVVRASPAPPHSSPRPSPTAAPLNSPEPTQAGPAKNGDGARAAQEQKRKQRQQAQAQRRAEREQQNAEKKQEPQATPGGTAPAPTESPTPAAIASPTPTRPDKQNAAEKRRAKRAERRAQRGQPQGSPEPGQSASPNGQQP